MPAFKIALPASMLGFIGSLVIGLGSVSTVGADDAVTFTTDDLTFFETKIRPVLAEHCYHCHSASSESLRAGLRVDSRGAMLAGGESGPAIVPGDVDGSLLIAAVRYESYEMPPSGKLPDAVIADLESWIDRSAAWPDEPEPTAQDDEGEVFDLEQRKASHWAWQPLQATTPPESVEGATEIDRYITAAITSAGLEPAATVDRAAWLRRLSFDLLGLPPTPEQVNAFVNDPGPDAFERWVDRFLDSPRFGERWGRHWLDLVRYAESRGHEFDQDTPGAHHYRDYVIRAFNADVPYDQFVREHISGDLIEEPRLHPEHGFNESILGTGFWFLGEGVHSPVDIRKDETDRFDNMIDCMSKTFLAMTVSCARCHDHKFDAISDEDYYALSGVLQSSQFRRVPFQSWEQNRRVADELQHLDVDYRERLQSVIASTLAVNASDAGSLSGKSPLVHDLMEPLEFPADDERRIVFDYTRSVDAAPTGDTVSELARGDFYADGFAYGDRPVRAGEWVIGRGPQGMEATLATYGSARNDPFWDGLTIEPDAKVNDQTRLNSIVHPGGALRTPTFELRGGYVALQVRGSGHVFACVDSHRLVAGPLHGNTVMAIAGAPANRVRWVHFDLTRYRGHRLHLELTPAENAPLELLRVVESPTTTAGTDWATDQEVAPLPLADLLDQLPPEAAESVGALQRDWLAQRETLSQQLHRHSPLAMAMIEGDGEDDRLLIRGHSATPGPTIPRRFLSAIDPTPIGGPRDSGRRELADRITDPNNPLYSRVIVNRVWHHLFGRGIVASVDDFGVLGQRPTHPELLDHLALWFLEHDQSIKQLIRYIVLTDAYRRSGDVTPLAQQIDPLNRWLHHREPKRLEGEAIRDTLLAVSGELDLTMFGPSVPVHLTSFMDGRGRPAHSGPLDGDRRRSIYLGIRRNFLSPFMTAFDMPVPFSTMGRRNVSNVPAQALILMNDPFVIQCAESWAERLIEAEPENSTRRLSLLYNAAFAREPSDRESALVSEFLERGHDDASRSERAVWAELAHVIINSKEFIFIP